MIPWTKDLPLTYPKDQLISKANKKLVKSLKIKMKLVPNFCLVSCVVIHIDSRKFNATKLLSIRRNVTQW